MAKCDTILLNPHTMTLLYASCNMSMCCSIAYCQTWLRSPLLPRLIQHLLCRLPWGLCILLCKALYQAIQQQRRIVGPYFFW